jgi:hypothetical protein
MTTMRASRVLSIAVSLAALAACAGTSSSAAGVKPISTGVGGGAAAGNLRVVANDPTTQHKVPNAPEQVWRSLPAVFDSIGIPVANLDAPKRVMGNSAFKIRGRLKNVPLSRYIDCGTSTQIGPNADNYDVNISLLAEVKPGESGTTLLVTTFDAVARPANFAQAYSQCSSKGTLEARFVELVNGQAKR